MAASCVARQNHGNTAILNSTRFDDQLELELELGLNHDQHPKRSPRTEVAQRRL